MKPRHAALVLGTAVIVLAAAAIAGPSAADLSCKGDRFAVVSVSRDPGSPGAPSAETALRQLASMPGFPRVASLAITEGGASITQLPQPTPSAGVEFLISADGLLLARVGVSHLEDGTWAADGWTECA